MSSPAKETRTFATLEGEKPFVLEQAIVCDFGLVRAWKGDRHGNLMYRQSARNFNPMAAMSGKITIAEVEQLVEPGDLDPERDPHARGLRPSRRGPDPEQAADKRIERSTAAPTSGR